MKKSTIRFAATLLAALAFTKAEAGDLSAMDLSAIDASMASAGTTANETPSSYANRSPIYAFNGAGLAGGNHSSAANYTMYMNSANDNGSFPWYIQIDLGEVKRIDGVRLYNFNFAKYTSRGVSNFVIYATNSQVGEYSAAGIAANYTMALSGKLEQASGTDDYSGEEFLFQSPVAARFLALVAYDDFDENNENLYYNGIAEIQLLYEEGAALPGATGNFSICCAGDSITEGANSASAANKWTYRTYLPAALKKYGIENATWKGSHISPYSGNNFASEGWCGKNAEEIAAKYIAAGAADSADFLLLHAGHNYDVTTKSEEEIIAATTNAHAKIIACAREHNPNTTILYAKVITSGKLPKYGYIENLNKAIEKNADDLRQSSSEIIVVDMARDWDYTKHCIDDKVHPNEEGARLMAKRWCEAMMKSKFMNPIDKLVEAESFADKGGWVVDPQFADIMGSPYLLAHGKGVKVANARENVAVGDSGLVRAWVRTRDWTPDYEGIKPGRFRLKFGEETFPATLGVMPADWGWTDAGIVRAEKGNAILEVEDLTGFEGRFDAIYLTGAAITNSPPGNPEELDKWRAEKLPRIRENVNADLVVVGGGIAGTCAAIAAADAGLSVALIQDRPMLGGNASNEIRVRTERNGDEYHWIVKAIKNRSANSLSKEDDDRLRGEYVASFPAISCYTNYRAFAVEKNSARRILSVSARNVESGEEKVFRAPLFVDATGDGWIGYWAGAAYRVGREATTEFNEVNYGQVEADSCTMGNSLLWTSKTAAEATAFPAVPWAKTVSGTKSATSGNWQWEAGLGPDEDTIYDAEMLRDRLFRAIYGCFANAKNAVGNEKLVLDWGPYIAGKRESRRIVGDYVVSERDVLTARKFDDAIGIATWTIDLHFYKDDSGFISATEHKTVPKWWMPYRSLCCRDVPNLFIAGRCASYTHVAFGSSRVMNAGGQQGVAAGYAAALCKKYGCAPRGIYEDAGKIAELQSLINKKGEYSWPKATMTIEHNEVVVDNDDENVEISGEWRTSTYSNDRIGKNYIHNNKAAAEDLWAKYMPTIPEDGLYHVFLFWNGDSSRSSKVPVEITHANGVTTNYVNQQLNSAIWNDIGAWQFKKGDGAAIRILTIGQENQTVIADAVKLAMVEEIEPSKDSDGNGLGDEWERKYFLQTSGTDPMADPDGDGYTNRDEYYMGTNPIDPNSPFEYQDFEVSGVEITLGWKGKRGRQYQIYEAEKAGEFVPLGEPIEGTDGEMNVVLPKGSSPLKLYCIKAIDL